MRYDTPRHRTRARLLTVRRDVPLSPCRRPLRVQEHAGTEVLAGPPLFSLGVVSYRVHTTATLVSVMLMDGHERFTCAVTIDLPLRRVDGTRLRILRSARLWEVAIWPDRFELSRDRQLTAVLGRDDDTGLWIGDASTAILLQEAGETLSLIDALLIELDDHGIVDLG
jgi:hypothetical protein